MTVMTIDHKTGDTRKYSHYMIDRSEYPTLEDLKNLALECLNDNAYSIQIF